MVSLVFIYLRTIYRQNTSFRALHNGVISLSSVRPFCQMPSINNYSLSVSPSTAIKRACFWVCESYYNQQRKPSHLNPTHSLLNLPIDSDFLSPDQAITVVASLAEEEGSMVALSFFYWAIGFPKFRHFMRFYIISATCLIKNGNFERTHEVLRCMVRNFSEIGMLKEAVYMVLEMQSQGLVLTAHTLNCVLSVVNGTGCFEMAETVFDEMLQRGVVPDPYSFKSMAVIYCRLGMISDSERWLSSMLSRGFLVDNATCSLIIVAFCKKGFVNRAVWLFNKMVGMGLVPNVINYSCLINGLSGCGRIKQSFELLEEMVRVGMKPNVYTHTALIDGLCKKGWTDKAFRLFLKLVRSDNYKPNVQTYTAMISGYCKEGKLNRAEMLLVKMEEQGLMPNLSTYTTLIDGHAKIGNFDRVYELMDVMGKYGLVPNICTYNAIIDGLCKKGRVNEAYGCFQGNGLCPDKFTYTILICESCKQDDIKQALALINKMMKTGISPDMHTYTVLISSFSRQKKMGECVRIFYDAIDMGFTPTAKTYTSMISGYCRDGDADMAMIFFNKMRENGCVPDSFTYGALISGLCKKSMLDEARIFYEEMTEKGVSPCEVTRLTIAYEFCKKDECLKAMGLLERLEKRLWVRTVRTLVRKLCSEKKVEMAAHFFDKLLDLKDGVDRVTLAGFMSACYDSNNYALVSDMSRRMTEEKGFDNWMLDLLPSCTKERWPEEDFSGELSLIYISFACPWSSRCLAYLKIRGLDKAISFSGIRLNASSLRVNEKSDIYSFGVVILELVTRKPPIDPEFGEKNLVKWVCSILDQKGIDHVIDPKLESCFKDEICRVMNIGLRCTSSVPINRPPMRRVVKMIQDDCVYISCLRIFSKRYIKFWSDCRYSTPHDWERFLTIVLLLVDAVESCMNECVCWISCFFLSLACTF
ncbi:hypothetical protein CASFOL_001569 [Castilleja foliolosa]|uniref:Pentatricopeptide repeat-containing protein n=1 Tax=Castilleja foliolosa TaxID=1961234 RepID=A0ABD3EK47_9LAMI